YISGPITDRIRFSLAAYEHKSDGYFKFLAPLTGHPEAIEQTSVRAKLQADITDDLSATLSYNYGLSSDPRGIFFTTYDHRPAFLPPAGPPGTVAFNYDTLLRGITNEYNLKLAWKTPIGTLTSYSGYALRRSDEHYDFDGTYQDLASSIFRFREP